MARGRLISRTLGSSRKFAALRREGGALGEFAQALYPLLVAHSDDFGRISGDAFTVKHAVFASSPRREADFATVLHAMATVKLIEWYDADGTQVIQIVDFEAHQGGLHKRTESRFPGNSGNFPEIPGRARARNRTELNRRELKGTEEKGTESRQTDSLRCESQIPDADASAEDADLDLTEANKPHVGAFIKRFCEFYTQYRHGARYHVRKARDAPVVRQLLAVYPAAHLAKLAVMLLTTDDEWISNTDRGIGILSTKASWLADKLAAYEAEHGVIPVAS